MGLDCSHDAFHGSYNAFNCFRKVLAKLMGGSYPPHDDHDLDDNSWYWGDGFNKETHPGLYIFFCHSDCDGDIKPSDCKLVADDLRKLLPIIEDREPLSSGHIARDGGYKKVLEKFIHGCDDAYNQNEHLIFG